MIRKKKRAKKKPIKKPAKKVCKSCSGEGYVDNPHYTASAVADYDMGDTNFCPSPQIYCSKCPKGLRNKETMPGNVGKKGWF